MSKGQRENASVKKYRFDMSGHAVFKGAFDVFLTYGISCSDLDLRHVDGYEQLVGPKFSYWYAHWHGGNRRVVWFAVSCGNAVAAASSIIIAD